MEDKEFTDALTECWKLVPVFKEKCGDDKEKFVAFCHGYMYAKEEAKLEEPSDKGE